VSKKFFNEIFGVSRKRSNRSSSGPDKRLWYFFIWAGVQRQVADWVLGEDFEAPPHGQGFIAASRIKFAGNVMRSFAREMWITPSSKGWRRVSRTCLGNSVISSRKRTPLWARVISPGLILVPPPTIATWEAVWWTSRNGRLLMRGWSFGRAPRIE